MISIKTDMDGSLVTLECYKRVLQSRRRFVIGDFRNRFYLIIPVSFVVEVIGDAAAFVGFVL